MKFDSFSLKNARTALAKLSTRIYDSKLPKNMISDEYVQRMKRKAAVCVALANVDNHASMILTLRSKTVGTHQGQVSFPGGHIENGETAETACLRELKEEICLDAEVLGVWHDVRAVTGTMVTPVVCFVSLKNLLSSDIHSLPSDKGEVELAFSIKLDDLVKPESCKMELLNDRWTMPRFQVRDTFGKPTHPPIWGLTAFIIEGVLKEVLIPSFDCDHGFKINSALSESDIRVV